MVYKGWIKAQKKGGTRKERGFLEKLGVKIGRYDQKDDVFEDCEVSEEVFKKLAPYTERFICY